MFGMGIKIGDGNKIQNSTISENVNSGTEIKSNNKNWFERHPFLVSVLASIIGGFIMLFRFWDKIVLFIENLFRGQI